MQQHFDTVIIGGGQAGLSLGYFLRQSRLRFAIIDGAPEVGHSWRTRYNSLRLFTPAQYNNLPGLPFPAAPSHYPTKDEVADYLQQYVRTHDLPVRSNTKVTTLHSQGDGFLLETTAGAMTSHQVVVATGPFQRPYIPPAAAGLSPLVYQVHSAQYQSPAQLPEGPVLVVGAGNSGAQIAEELSRTHRVLLSAGKRYPSLPQRLLGKDLFWWLHTLGLMNLPASTWLGRRMQQKESLIGTDLRSLQRTSGVEIIPRVLSAAGDQVTTADQRTWQVHSVIWATGYRPDYSWLHLPVLGEDGKPIHERGVSNCPGLYFLGLPWQHTRGSALLGGVGRDAAYLAGRITERAASLHRGTPPEAAAD